MPSFRTGTVERVVESRDDMQVLDVRVGTGLRSAVLYLRFAAPASPGDRVVLNTTAVDLGLGSGGYDFVVWNLAAEMYDAPSGGHVMKLRYTPDQCDVRAVEEEADDLRDLSSAPVVATSVHSQLVPVVAAVRSRVPGARVAYVMTDGGGLEAAPLRNVRRMREMGWLAGVVTTGHALGGDVEAVNLYSGLLAARGRLDAELIVAGMGPGVVGTGSSFGTTAIELGIIVNAAHSLDGRPIAAIRMSSADSRERHAGVSHHSVVALRWVTLASADVPVPVGERDLVRVLEEGHRVVEVDARPVLAELGRARDDGLEVTHMGRGPEDDQLFFLAAGAAGYHAASLL